MMASPSVTRQYLPEIDSLRAIAVVLVLLFHAYPRTFPAGYLGVDMFFVISGYVISRSYLFPLLERRKSLGDFYAARFRRLAPALFVTVAATTAVAFSLLPPRELQAFANALAAQVFYVQNIYFWAEGDYFVQPLQKPLLHTWSLAVEEQFYLLWGLSFLVHRRWPALFWPIVLGAFAVSLALFVLLGATGLSPRTAFYLLPARLWQLGCGVVAFCLVVRSARSNSRTLPWLTLAATAMATAAALVAADSKLLSPLQTLAVCLGTAVALACLDLQPTRQASLSVASVRYVGRMSYSLYLWHWPVISLSALWLRRPLSPLEATAALALSAVLAVASYHLLEKPIRERRLIASRLALSRAVVATSATTLAVAALLVATGGATFRYGPETRRILAADQDRAMPRCPFGQSLLHPLDVLCQVNRAQGSNAIVVMGDSHSDQYTNSLAALGDAHDVRVYFTVKSNWVLGHFGPGDWGSTKTLASILAEARARGARDILSISRWTPEEGDTNRYEQNVAELTASGFRLTVLEQNPVHDGLDPTLRVLQAGPGGGISRGGIPKQDYLKQVAALRRLFDQLARRFPGRFFSLSPEQQLCLGEECLFEMNGRPIYFDSNHITQTGAALVKPLFEPLFQQLASGR